MFLCWDLRWDEFSEVVCAVCLFVYISFTIIMCRLSKHSLLLHVASGGSSTIHTFCFIATTKRYCSVDWEIVQWWIISAIDATILSQLSCVICVLIAWFSFHVYHLPPGGDQGVWVGNHGGNNYPIWFPMAEITIQSTKYRSDEAQCTPGTLAKSTLHCIGLFLSNNGNVCVLKYHWKWYNIGSFGAASVQLLPAMLPVDTVLVHPALQPSRSTEWETFREWNVESFFWIEWIMSIAPIQGTKQSI